MSRYDKMIYNEFMLNEKGIQKILYKQTVKIRNMYNIAIPNIYMFGKSESDYIGISRYGYVHEYEIKTSKQDFLNDFSKSKHKKMHSYYKSPSETDAIPRRFYFVAHGFWPVAGELPDYAGLITITENGIMKIIRRAPDLPSKKIDERTLIKMCTSLSYRLWERW